MGTWWFKGVTGMFVRPTWGIDQSPAMPAPRHAVGGCRNIPPHWSGGPPGEVERLRMGVLWCGSRLFGLC